MSSERRLIKEKRDFGGTCQETNKCFLFTVNNRRADMPIIVEHTAPGSIIMYDKCTLKTSIMILQSIILKISSILCQEHIHS